jgi:hypothetical protein
MDKNLPTSTKKNLTLDGILREIEFPGEERSVILRFLEQSDFDDRVLTGIELAAQRRKTKRILTWVFFLLFNLALILLSGTDNALLKQLFSFEQIFSIIFSLVLGIIILATTIGLILTIDTSWLKRFTRVHEPNPLVKPPPKKKRLSLDKSD